MRDARDIIGVLPAAGRARRLGRLPCSKEILPVGVGPAGLRPAIACALEALAGAGAAECWICIAPGKEDIPDLLGGNFAGMRLLYHVVADSAGAPDSVRSLGDRLADRTVVLAFPDIQFAPLRAVSLAVGELDGGEADLCLALVPSDRGDKVDLVECDGDGRIVGLSIKPGPGHGGWTWVSAAWGPGFTRVLLEAPPGGDGDRETYFGDVIHRGLQDGLAARAVKVAAGRMLDIGTPADYAQAWAEAPSAGDGARDS